MNYSLDNYEYNLDEIQINKIKKLFSKFSSSNARVERKMSQLTKIENDMGFVLEIESLINSSN